MTNQDPFFFWLIAGGLVIIWSQVDLYHTLKELRQEIQRLRER